MVILIYMFVIGITAVTIYEPSANKPTVEESQSKDRPEFVRK